MASLRIDGGKGSGSGTIVRYALALSALAGKDLQLFNIRARRNKPGLRPQHLATANAVQEMCEGYLEGAEVGSLEIFFRPGAHLKSGSYHWDIGTSGSATMLALNILPLACLCPGEVSARIKGGTFQGYAPSALYLQKVLAPLVSRMGAQVEIDLVRAGYPPSGGGELFLRIKPSSEGLQPLQLIDPGVVEGVGGVAFSSHLQERQVSERMAAAANKALNHKGYKPRISCLEDKEALQPGAAIVLWANTSTGCLLGADALGQIRRTSEQVGREAARYLQRDLAAGGTVDRFASDQLVVFAALAKGETIYRAPFVSEHLQTNLSLIEEIYGAKVAISDNFVSIKG